MHLLVLAVLQVAGYIRAVVALCVPQTRRAVWDPQSAWHEKPARPADASSCGGNWPNSAMYAQLLQVVQIALMAPDSLLAT